MSSSSSSFFSTALTTPRIVKPEEMPIPVITSFPAEEEALSSSPDPAVAMPSARVVTKPYDPRPLPSRPDFRRIGGPICKWSSWDPNVHGRAFGGYVNKQRTYQLTRYLNHGSFSLVYMAMFCPEGRPKEDHKEVAIKMVPKHKGQDRMNEEDELYVLRKINHNHMVELHDEFETDDAFFYVLSFAAGGDLDDYLAEEGPLPEKEVRDIMRQLLRAVATLHQHSIIHHDIKPANILLRHKDDTRHIWLSDFGVSKKIYDPKDRSNYRPGFVPPLLGKECSRMAGTLAFLAPELLDQCRHGKPVDMWAIGVTAFSLLRNYLPFLALDQADLLREIRSRSYLRALEGQDSVSSEAMDFVKKLLVEDPEKRMTATQALLHPFVDRGIVLPYAADRHRGKLRVRNVTPGRSQSRAGSSVSGVAPPNIRAAQIAEDLATRECTHARGSAPSDYNPKAFDPSFNLITIANENSIARAAQLATTPRNAYGVALNGNHWNDDKDCRNWFRTECFDFSEPFVRVALARIDQPVRLPALADLSLSAQPEPEPQLQPAAATPLPSANKKTLETPSPALSEDKKMVHVRENAPRAWPTLLSVRSKFENGTMEKRRKLKAYVDKLRADEEEDDADDFFPNTANAIVRKVPRASDCNKTKEPILRRIKAKFLDGMDAVGLGPREESPKKKARRYFDQIAERTRREHEAVFGKEKPRKRVAPMGVCRNIWRKIVM